MSQLGLSDQGGVWKQNKLDLLPGCRALSQPERKHGANILPPTQDLRSGQDVENLPAGVFSHAHRRGVTLQSWSRHEPRKSCEGRLSWRDGGLWLDTMERKLLATCLLLLGKDRRCFCGVWPRVEACRIGLWGMGPGTFNSGSAQQNVRRPP